MKKCLTFLSLTAFVFAGSMAVAADAAEMFKSSCAGCHGVDGSKSAGGTTPLKGQKADAVLKMLEGYKGGSFGGDKKAIMENVVKKHSADDLKQLAEYIGTL